MPTPPVTDEELIETVRAVNETGGKTQAARVLGVSRPAIQHRMREAEKRGIWINNGGMEAPEFDGSDAPIEEILARYKKGFERKLKAAESRDWYAVKVNETKPYGILWFGDPHLGPHCDWKTLEAHLEVARQPGVYGGNIGDTTDNWSWTGRMAKLWAENDITHGIERQLAEWFMFQAGVKWLVWIIGNHDAWNNGSYFHKQLGANVVPTHDWRAQFRLVHKGGVETKIDAAHGRKGNSIYNPVHGTLRDAKFGGMADLYVSGHIHQFGLQEIEFPEQRHRTWLMQVSGYKCFDEYALVNGWQQTRYGSGAMSIHFPATGRVLCFSDPVEGADYLKFLRNGV